MWWVLKECENHPIILGLGLLFGFVYLRELIEDIDIPSPRTLWEDFLSDRRKRLIKEIELETEKVKKERDIVYKDVSELLNAVNFYLCWEWPKVLPDEDKEKGRKRLVIFLQYLDDWKVGFTPLYLPLYELRMKDIRKKKWISHLRFWEEKRKKISFLLSEFTPQIQSFKEWVMDKENEKKEVKISFSSILEEIRSLDRWEKMNLKGVK